MSHPLIMRLIAARVLATYHRFPDNRRKITTTPLTAPAVAITASLTPSELASVCVCVCACCLVLLVSKSCDMHAAHVRCIHVPHVSVLRPGQWRSSSPSTNTTIIKSKDLLFLHTYTTSAHSASSVPPTERPGEAAARSLRLRGQTPQLDTGYEYY